MEWKIRRRKRLVWSTGSTSVKAAIKHQISRLDARVYLISNTNIGAARKVTTCAGAAVASDLDIPKQSFAKLLKSELIRDILAEIAFEGFLAF